MNPPEAFHDQKDPRPLPSPISLALPASRPGPRRSRCPWRRPWPPGSESSPGLHASRLKLEAASANAREIAAGRLPALKLGGGYTRLSEVPDFQVTLPISPEPRSSSRRAISTISTCASASSSRCSRASGFRPARGPPGARGRGRPGPRQGPGRARLRDQERLLGSGPGQGIREGRRGERPPGRRAPQGRPGLLRSGPGDQERRPSDRARAFQRRDHEDRRPQRGRDRADRARQPHRPAARCRRRPDDARREPGVAAPGGRRNRGGLRRSRRR